MKLVLIWVVVVDVVVVLKNFKTATINLKNKEEKTKK